MVTREGHFRLCGGTGMFIISRTSGHQGQESLLDDRLGKPACKTQRLLTQYLGSWLGRPHTEGRKVRSLFTVPLLHLFFLILHETELLDPVCQIQSICLPSSRTLSRTSVHQGELSWEMLYPGTSDCLLSLNT